MVAVGATFAGAVALLWIGTILMVMIGTFALALGFDAPKDAGRSLPPCATEDSSGCYWDASERGNHAGHDVVNP